MKRRIFWSVFYTVFLRLQIYEATAAIFLQSTSYVRIFVIVGLFVYHIFIFCLFETNVTLDEKRANLGRPLQESCF